MTESKPASKINCISHKRNSLLVPIGIPIYVTRIIKINEIHHTKIDIIPCEIPVIYLSGHWFGRWDHAWACQLLVEQIDSKKAVGNYYFLRDKPIRIEVNVTPEGKI